jgi:uncharacterized membrane protein YesL
MNKPEKKTNVLLGGVFAPGGAVVSTLDFFSDMVILNVLCVICSLPLVTAPASLSAAFLCTQKILRGEGSGTLAMFFRCWRSSFRRVTPMGLGLLALGALLRFELSIAAQMPAGMGDLLHTGLTAALLVWLGVGVWVLPVLHGFEKKGWSAFKLAAALSIANLPQTFGMVMAVVLPWLILRLIPGGAGVVILLSLIVLVEGAVLVNVLLSENVLRKL